MVEELPKKIETIEELENVRKAFSLELCELVNKYMGVNGIAYADVMIILNEAVFAVRESANNKESSEMGEEDGKKT
jgi:hypothetical protein